MTDINWQGEDGEPGYPGPQGPPGAKVSYLINNDIVFYVSYINIEIWTALNQGEPGMGQKGERGLDGLPGIKVHKPVIILYFSKYLYALTMSNIYCSCRAKVGKEESKAHKDQWYPSGQQCVLSLCSSCSVSLMLSSRFQGYPGEKGSSDIIDFNGELRDALRVSGIKASAIEVRLTASLCAAHRQPFITVSDRSGAEPNKYRSWKINLDTCFSLNWSTFLLDRPSKPSLFR